MVNVCSHFEFSVKTIYFLEKRSYDIEVEVFIEMQEETSDVKTGYKYYAGREGSTNQL